MSIDEKQKFTLNIPVKFEPGRINVFDIDLFSPPESNSYLNGNTFSAKNVAKLVILNDDELDYHSISYKQTRTEIKKMNELTKVDEITYNFT